MDGMLIELRDRIEKGAAKEILLKTCEQFRKDLKGYSLPTAQKAKPRTSGDSDEKIMVRVDKVVKKTVSDRKQLGALFKKPA
jgi:hypothetical protein